MEKTTIITLAFIHGGSLIGLFSSLAHPIFWLIELPVAFIISFVIIKMMKNYNIEELPFILSSRILFLLTITLYSSMIFTYFIDYWKEIIGCLIGSLIALWADYLLIFYEKRVSISLKALFVIISKTAGIFMMNFSLLFYLEENKNYLFFVENALSSFVFFTVISEIVYTNIYSINVNEMIEMDNLFNKFQVSLGLDNIFSGILFLQSMSYSRDEYKEWKYGLLISFISNIIAFFIKNSNKKKIRIHPIVNRLKEIYIVIQPDLDIKIGEKL